MKNKLLLPGLLAAASGAYLLRRQGRLWGASDDEVHRSMPGDELIPYPMVETTHAITVQASAAEIWPWLVQMGMDRGGWYSFLHCCGHGEEPGTRSLFQLACALHRSACSA